MNLNLRTPAINWAAPEWQYPTNTSDSRYYNPDGTRKPLQNTPLQDKVTAYHQQWDAKRAAAPSPQQAYNQQVANSRPNPVAPKPATPVQPVAATTPKPVPKAAAPTPAQNTMTPAQATAGLGGGKHDQPQPQIKHPTPNLYPVNPEAQQAANAFQNLHSNHFGQQARGISDLNSALSNASNQWAEAAARNQGFQQRQWEAGQASQLEMAKMQSQERMAQAELNERAEKRKALTRMMGGFSPLGRSLLG